MAQIIKSGSGGQGKSAYDIALDNGFVGDEPSWLLSLKGKDGTNGTQGKQGIQGNPGTPGAPGVKGDPGKDGLPGKDGVSVTGLKLVKSGTGEIVSATITTSDGKSTPVLVESEVTE